MPSDIVIHDIRVTVPDCPPGTDNGVIEIEASVSTGALEYSIDSGGEWSPRNVFPDLRPGSYGVQVRKETDHNDLVDGGTAEVPAPLCPEGCQDVDDPCGTTLFPGDLCIIGFDNYIVKRGVRVVVATLVKINRNTHFSIAHTVYESGAAAGMRTDRWFDGMGGNAGNIASQKILYKGAVPIPAGSVICFDLPQAGSGPALLANNFRVNNQPSSDFCVFSNGLAGNPLIQFSTTEPSAIFLLQGDWTHLFKFSTFCGRVLCGLQDGGAWIPPSQAVPMNSRRSRVHPHIGCFPERTSLTPMPYATYFPADGYTYTPLAFLAEVIDYDNEWEHQLPNTQGDDVSGRGCGVRFVVDAPMS